MGSSSDRSDTSIQHQRRPFQASRLLFQMKSDKNKNLLVAAVAAR